MVNEETATVKLLLKWLSTKPLLWIGAGLSVAAGYPSTSDLVKELCASVPNCSDSDQPDFTKVVDLYKTRYGDQGLAYFLNTHIGVTRQPVAMHKYIADLASEQNISSIYTTNYDDLIERSLRNEGVHVLTQAGSDNLGLTLTNPTSKSGRDFFLVSKVHGDGQAWKNAVLSGESYEAYYSNRPWMRQQITHALSNHCVVFLGCSLQDPRLLSWLLELTNEEAEQLNPWMCMMPRGAWRLLEKYKWNGLDAKLLLNRANLTVALFDDHARLPALWSDVVKEICPKKPRRAFLPAEWEEIDKARKRMRIIIMNRIAEDSIRMQVSGWNVDKKNENMPRWAMRYHQPSLAFEVTTARYLFNLYQYLPEANDNKMDWEQTNYVDLEAIPGTYYFEFSKKPITKHFLWIAYQSVGYTLLFTKFVPWDILVEAGEYKMNVSDEIEVLFRRNGTAIEAPGMQGV